MRRKGMGRNKNAAHKEAALQLRSRGNWRAVAYQTMQVCGA